ncbi:phosphoglycerate mutase-like protein [Linderina pennispora]|uniref:Multiple inositol polyphosphate phosphatase 1 n=1 Tax=Linderina pennispora TaxID=61395 RepID=A0A1Y1VXF0_9FUNG|nr:phosphoglycerate mutase-like protein [Linderina pennispora]ORX65957.1 phosphoglycerate mutase-like protein [Linderina pennispora]
MSKLYGILTLCLIAAVYTVHRSSDERQYRGKLHLSTKTSYPHHASEQLTLPSDVTLVKVQYVSRHGTRYPMLNDMARIRKLLGKIQVPAHWMPPDLIDDQNAGKLASTGHTDMHRLGQRALKRYRDLLNTTATTAIGFQSSESARSIDSAMAFMSALDLSSHLNVIPRANDTTLAMKYNCPLWSHYKQKMSADISSQVAIFDSLHAARIQSRLEQKLGALLPMGDIATLYLLCGYDLALYGNHGKWCSLIDEPMSFWLELRNDIKYSRVYGPDGADINRHIACSLVSEILDELEHGSALAIFKFGHAETVMFLSTLMHLDSALGSSDMAVTGAMSLSQARARGFQTSLLVPFSANIIFELYQDLSHRLLVRMLVNEQPIRLQQCGGSYLCPLSTLHTAFGNDVGCELAKVCSVLNL